MQEEELRDRPVATLGLLGRQAPEDPVPAWVGPLEGRTSLRGSRGSLPGGTRPTGSRPYVHIVCSCIVMMLTFTPLFDLLQNQRMMQGQGQGYGGYNGGYQQQQQGYGHQQQGGYPQQHQHQPVPIQAPWQQQQQQPAAPASAAAPSATMYEEYYASLAAAGGGAAPPA